MMIVVPVNEPLQAEVYVSHHDVGFVQEGHTTRLKLMSYEFQKYGMIDAKVAYVSADSSENPNNPMQNQGYKAIIAFDQQFLGRDGKKFNLRAGMQVSAEIKIGSRTVVDYLLSPIKRAVNEAAKER